MNEIYRVRTDDIILTSMLQSLPLFDGKELSLDSSLCLFVVVLVDNDPSSTILHKKTWFISEEFRLEWVKVACPEGMLAGIPSGLTSSRRKPFLFMSC